VLQRGPSADQGTFGRLLDANGEMVCWMLELPDRANEPNYSRIPAGRYEAHYLPRSASGRYQRVYWLPRVSGRSGILIHGGNYAGDCRKEYRTDTCGCLLPARRLGVLNGQRVGLASRAALNALHKATGRQHFMLEVHDHD